MACQRPLNDLWTGISEGTQRALLLNHGAIFYRPFHGPEWLEGKKNEKEPRIVNYGELITGVWGYYQSQGPMTEDLPFKGCKWRKGDNGTGC